MHEIWIGAIQPAELAGNRRADLRHLGAFLNPPFLAHLGGPLLYERRSYL